MACLMAISAGVAAKDGAANTARVKSSVDFMISSLIAGGPFTVRPWVRESVDGTNAIRLRGTASLARSLVISVPSTVCRPFEREGDPQRRARNIHAVAEGRAICLAVDQNALQPAHGDVEHVVSQAPSVGKAGRIAGDEAETLGGGGAGGRNPGVEPEQVRDRTALC